MLRELADTSYVRPAVSEPGRCYYRVDLPGLRLLCCDSSVPGHHHGILGNTQLLWLDRELGRGTETPAVIALHHHPIRSGIAAMDDIMLRDAAELGAVLSRHPRVARVLTGHLHRPMTGLLAGVVVTSAPSTDRQVHLDLDPDGPGAFIEEPPGIMLHCLDGTDDVSHLIPVRKPRPRSRQLLSLIPPASPAGQHQRQPRQPVAKSRSVSSPAAWEGAHDVALAWNHAERRWSWRRAPIGSRGSASKGVAARCAP